MPSRPPKTDPEALIAALAEDARRRAAEAGAGPDAAEPLAADPAAEAAAARWPEPDPDQLLDYLEGRLPADEAAKLERRLVADPAAARALADLAELSAAETAAPPAADAPADLAVHAGWRELEPRLGGARRRGGGRGPWLPALAAAATLTAAVLGFRVVTLQQMLARPFAVAESVELFAGARAGGLEPEQVEVKEGERLLVTLDPEPCDSYRVAIEPEGGGGELVVDDLRRDAQDLVMFHWQPAAGLYTLTLSGCEPPRVLETHGLEVVRPPPGAGGDGG